MLWSVTNLLWKKNYSSLVTMCICYFHGNLWIEEPEAKCAYVIQDQQIENKNYRWFDHQVQILTWHNSFQNLHMCTFFLFKIWSVYPIWLHSLIFLNIVYLLHYSSCFPQNNLFKHFVIITNCFSPNLFFWGSTDVSEYFLKKIVRDEIILSKNKNILKDFVNYFF